MTVAWYSDLSRCGLEPLKAFYTIGVRAKAGVQCCGSHADVLGCPCENTIHSRQLLFLFTDSCSHDNGVFSISLTLDIKALEQIFPRKRLTF
jgi:hypothetical protein